MPKKLAFICWSKANTRADSLAHHLGIECRYVHDPRSSRNRYLYAPIKYLLATRKTWSVLQKERPERVLVTTPPPFAALAVWFYCLITGARFVTDTHSGAFNLRRWKPFLRLTRFLARRAIVNIFHSEAAARLVSGWGAKTIALGDIPYHLETGRNFPIRKGFSLACPCTFAEDEPVDAVVAAARQLPAVDFYITGDLDRAPKDLRLRVPQNVLLTGYLPRPEYAALLEACHGVLALTTRDLTVQNAAYEAVELGKPLITSGWPVLREAYPSGAIYVDNTPAGLVQAVQQLQAEYPCYCSEILRLREEIHASWPGRLSAFLQMIE